MSDLKTDEMSKKVDSVSKKIHISIDKTIDDVLKLDEEGKVLVFDTSPGRFLELPESVIRELGKENKEKYFVAFHAYMTSKQSENFLPTEGLSTSPNYASATERMNVIYPEEFKKKYKTCWKRPDQLPIAQREGYFIVRKEHGVTSFNYDKQRNCHVVGALGHAEMILMACPIEMAEAKLKAVEERSRTLSGNVVADGKRELKDLGGKPFEGEAFGSLDFKETREG